MIKLAETEAEIAAIGSIAGSGQLGKAARILEEVAARLAPLEAAAAQPLTERQMGDLRYLQKKEGQLRTELKDLRAERRQLRKDLAQLKWSENLRSIQHVGIIEEGLTARISAGGFCSMREKTVAALLDAVAEDGAVLIRAPPQSGQLQNTKLMTLHNWPALPSVPSSLSAATST